MKNATAEVIEFNPAQVAAFDEFRSQLVELATMNSKAVFDYESPAGNKEARSHVYRLRQTKSAVEQARKNAKNAALEYGREVDSQAREITTEIEAMIEVHAAPLREIEEREEARIQAHKDRVSSLTNYQTMPQDATAQELKAALDYVEGFVVDESLEEFMAEAQVKKNRAIAEISDWLEARTQYELEQEELRRLREEKAERERAEREEQIRKEAEKAAQERAEIERLEAEQKNQLALQAAQREVEIAKELAAKARQEALEQAQREPQEKQEAERKEAERREANKRHRAKITKQAIDGLVSAGFDEKTSKAIVAAIDSGKVPNVTINY